MRTLKYYLSPAIICFAAALIAATSLWILSLMASGYISGIIGSLAFSLELAPGQLRFNFGANDGASSGLKGWDGIFRTATEMREVFAKFSFLSDSGGTWIWIPFWMIVTPLVLIFPPLVLMRGRKVQQIRQRSE